MQYALIIRVYQYLSAFIFHVSKYLLSPNEGK